MNNSQRSRLDSCHRVQEICQANSSTLSSIPDYATEKGFLDDAIGKIETAVSIQTVPFGGESEASLAAKLAMIETVLKFCLRGSYKARRSGEYLIANALEMSKTDFRSAPKSVCVQMARAARKTISDNLVLLSNITGPDVTLMDTVIDAYDDIKDAPTEAREIKKADGTSVIETELLLAEEAKQFILRLAHSYLDQSHPSLVEKLMLASQIITTGVHHTEVEFSVENADGSAAIEAVVADQSNGKTYTADPDGKVFIRSHKMGNFRFQISAPGRQTVDFSAHINRGQHNMFTVRLSV